VPGRQTITLPEAKALVDADLALRGDAPTTGAETSPYAARPWELVLAAGDIRLLRLFINTYGCTPQQATRVPDPARPGRFLFHGPKS